MITTGRKKPSVFIDLMMRKNKTLISGRTEFCGPLGHCALARELTRTCALFPFVLGQGCRMN